jgi:uncharacterized membrane protein YhaH (DUF805 family)
MKWFVHCLRNSTNFAGRASRPEYWWFYLVVAVVGLGLNLIGSSAVADALRFIWGLGLLLPNLAVASRRMHDTGHSFWWFSGFLAAWLPFALVAVMYGPVNATAMGLYTLALLPYAAFVIYLLCKRGDSGPNRYGPPAPTSPT